MRPPLLQQTDTVTTANSDDTYSNNTIPVQQPPILTYVHIRGKQQLSKPHNGTPSQFSRHYYIPSSSSNYRKFTEDQKDFQIMITTTLQVFKQHHRIQVNARSASLTKLTNARVDWWEYFNPASLSSHGNSKSRVPPSNSTSAASTLITI